VYVYCMRLPEYSRDSFILQSKDASHLPRPSEPRYDLSDRCDSWDTEQGVGDRLPRGRRWNANEHVRSHAVRRIAGARSPRTAVLIDDQGERLICTYTIPRSTT